MGHSCGLTNVASANCISSYVGFWDQYATRFSRPWRLLFDILLRLAGTSCLHYPTRSDPASGLPIGTDVRQDSELNLPERRQAIGTEKSR